MIFKIVEREAWSAAASEGTYRGSPDDLRDGFIHFSAPHQLRGTAAKHFRGVNGLVLVAFDEGALGDTLKWEPSRGGDLFPHLYAKLPMSAVVWVEPLRIGVDGLHLIPAAVT
jgi:uncharacterized protein (DUF952 family)